ncbi:S-adenosylmethionine:tRNA ribosyltransferase-isomerase [Constrictibacter sp. MBR-5]|jgi:S-adenosylmethionine:tRNA ribosyltransferase-isomerase|uniref:tRNA preQ1(34) S-adenosylmethionine ribosyltransferase-isomerase QueA n=1 Tax=Constrictibacter sp. MBR-5 TaxID=3156467 RepID=UPI0033956399
MRTDLFDFDLPPDLIAQHAAIPRDAARLLDVRSDGLADRIVRDLPDLLRPGDVMVFNDTRVIPARLRGVRGAAQVEVTLHLQEGPSTWRTFARPARRLRPGETVRFGDGFTATVRSRDGGEVVLDFDRGGPDLLAALERHGEMPLPPYIRRPDGPEPGDADSYQTIFAAHPGAVAAPTAALHFTPDLLAALDARGVKRETLTLHVGAGTFLPVKVEDAREHRMHAEYGVIDAATAERLNAARAAGGRLVAVGTTALRLLESAASPDGRVGAFAGQTDIFILPGYRFRCVDLLMTNFHLPRSTLFMLVAAFAGLERMRSAYAHAVAAGYRFYSFGDSSLLHRADIPVEPSTP